MSTSDRPALSLAELEAFDSRPGGAGDERRFCCPLPACADKSVARAHQSLCANVASGLWLCNRCHATGKLRERWEQRTGRPGRELRRAKALRAFRLSPEPQPGQAASAAYLPELLARCRPVVGTPGERYLSSRGIGLDVATPAGVLWTADCYGRPGVVFPLHDQAGQLVAANVRHTDGRADPKTHSVGDRSLGAFATPGAWTAGAPLMLVEGPIDALSLAVCDVPAVALVATRAPHWLRTGAAFRRVLLGFDADEPDRFGVRAGDRAADVLTPVLESFGARVERLRPPKGCKDWNDALLADPAGLRQALAGAREREPGHLPVACATCACPVERFLPDGTAVCLEHYGRWLMADERSAPVETQADALGQPVEAKTPAVLVR